MKDTAESIERQIAHCESKIQELTNWLNSKENTGPEYIKNYKERGDYQKQLKALKNKHLSLSKF